MAENVEKEYYKDILELIDQKSQDSFYQEMLNAIKGGKLEVYQKRTRQQLTFDATWIEVIKNNLSYVEAIVRNPRQFMEANEEVTPIQRAKKINSRSVQHLSSHVQNVQEIRDDGTIVPSKLLSTTYEDTIIIYENRFVMTLINKLAAFIELRYTSILESVKSYQKDHLNAKSTFKWRNYDIEATIDLSVKNEITDEISKKNQELLNDIETIRNYIRGFMNSAFYIELKRNSKPVVPPILKTNIIQGSVNYNSCLKLWQFLDSYRQLGIDLDFMDKDLTFDNDFIQDVCDMFILNYSLITTNQIDRSETYELLPYKYKKEKAPINVRNLVAGDHDKLEGKDLEDPTISEYFYNRTKKKYKSEFTKDVNSGISYNKSFVSVYRRMQKIENGIQKEIIESLEEKIPETGTYDEQRQARYKYLKRVRSMYKTIIYLKKQDLMRMEQKLKKAERDLAKFEEEDRKYLEELKAKREEQLRLYQLQQRLENGEVVDDKEIAPVEETTPTEETPAVEENNQPTEETTPNKIDKYAHLRNAHRSKAGKETRVPTFKELQAQKESEEGSNDTDEQQNPEIVEPVGEQQPEVVETPVEETPVSEVETPEEHQGPITDKYAYLRKLSHGRKGGKEIRVPSFKELQALNEANKAAKEEQVQPVEETPIVEETQPVIVEPIVEEQPETVEPVEETTPTEEQPIEENTTPKKDYSFLHGGKHNSREKRVPSFKELEAMRKAQEGNNEEQPVVEETPSVEPQQEEVIPTIEVEQTPVEEEAPVEEQPVSDEPSSIDVSSNEPEVNVEQPIEEDNSPKKDYSFLHGGKHNSKEKRVPSFKELQAMKDAKEGKENEDHSLPTEVKTKPTIDNETRKNARYEALINASKGSKGKETRVPSFKELNKK